MHDPCAFGNNIWIFSYDIWIFSIFHKKIQYHLNTRHPKLAPTKIPVSCWADFLTFLKVMTSKRISDQEAVEHHFSAFSYCMEDGLHCLIRFRHWPSFKQAPKCVLSLKLSIDNMQSEDLKLWWKWCRDFYEELSNYKVAIELLLSLLLDTSLHWAKMHSQTIPSHPGL